MSLCEQPGGGVVAPRAERAFLKVLIAPELRDRVRQAAHLLQLDQQVFVADALRERLAAIVDEPVQSVVPPRAADSATLMTPLDPDLREQVRQAAGLLGISERHLVSDALSRKLASVDFDALIRKQRQALEELQAAARRRLAEPDREQDPDR